MKAAAIARAPGVPAVVGFASFVMLVALLEVAIRAGLVNRYIVPLPSQVAVAFERLIAEEHLADRFLVTFKECLAAALMIAIAGIAIGALLHKVDVLRRATETWVAAAAAAPTVLMYPLFLVIFGRSSTTIVMMAFVAGLPPVILKTIEGLAATRRVLIDVGRSFRLTHWQMFAKILFPAAMPTIFVGLKLGLVFALINVVGVEFLINFGGLGQLINDLAERYDPPGTYAAICFVVLVSVVFFFAIERIEGWLGTR